MLTPAHSCWHPSGILTCFGHHFTLVSLPSSFSPEGGDFAPGATSAGIALDHQFNQTIVEAILAYHLASDFKHPPIAFPTLARRASQPCRAATVQINTKLSEHIINTTAKHLSFLVSPT
jgi:hypothetical protein